MTEYVVYKDPSLADFILVCERLCPDEIEQYEAFAGEQYNAARVAAIYSLHQGPRWVLTADGQPIVIAGFDEIRQGVWQDWLLRPRSVGTRALAHSYPQVPEAHGCYVADCRT